jgi:hypothetical protein
MNVLLESRDETIRGWAGGEMGQTHFPEWNTHFLSVILERGSFLAE